VRPAVAFHPNQAPLPPGSIVRDYRIERRLGAKGGFAFTYLATHIVLKQPVALKELFPDNVVVRRGQNVVPVAGDTEKLKVWRWALRKFTEEARHLARFRHRNIVAVSDLLEANQTAYIVMQYVEGRSLDQFLNERGPRLAEAELQHIFRQILDGLEAVHHENILHRDVKPSNIYLTSRGRVILLDFGAARPERKIRTPSTTIGLHSEGYSPLEQYRTDYTLAAPADIYSAAATMCRAITGKNPPSALDRTANDPYVPLATRFGGRYSRSFLQAIDAGMAVDPNKRPQSIVQWRKMIEPGTPEPPNREGIKFRLPKLGFTHPRLILGMIACVLLCLGFVAAFLFSSEEGDESVKRAAELKTAPQPHQPLQAAARPVGPQGVGSSTAPAPVNAVPSAPPTSSPSPSAGDAANLEDELAGFVKREIENDVNAANYAPMVDVNDTGLPADKKNKTREQLVKDDIARDASYSINIRTHLGYRILNYDKAKDVADVQQFFSADRTTKKDRKRTLGITARLLQIIDAGKPGRMISGRTITDTTPGYRCRLSEADHRNSAGIDLVKGIQNQKTGPAVKSIILQDRINYEAGRRDKEDMPFPLYHDPAGRERISQIPDEGIVFLPSSTESLNKILEGTPIVDVFPDPTNKVIVIIVKK
jgi:serine/threonine protein kinase